MSTYSDSKIQTARKAYECTHCDGKIEQGQKYLRYALGQRWRVAVCLNCAATSPSYRCGAVDELRAA